MRTWSFAKAAPAIAASLASALLAAVELGFAVGDEDADALLAGMLALQLLAVRLKALEGTLEACRSPSRAHGARARAGDFVALTATWSLRMTSS